MSVVALDAITTLANGGTVTGAGGDADLAMRDGLDSTYVSLDVGQTLSLSYAAPSLPSGAIVKDIKAVVRARCDAFSPALLQVIAENQTDGNGVTDLLTISNSVNGNFITAAGVTNEDVDGQVTVTAFSDTVHIVSLYLQVTYVTKPTVTITAPSGTLSETLMPTVSWLANLDSDGGGQFGYQVKIYNDGTGAGGYNAGGFDPDTSTPVWESSGFTPTTSVTVDESLADDGYRAYVKVSQLVNWTLAISSDWSYSAFTITVDRPANPSFSLTAQNSSGRVKIDCSDNAGDAATHAFQIQHKVDGEWEYVRAHNTDGIEPMPDPTLYDYEMQPGTVDYRVRAVTFYTGFDAVYSDWVTHSTTYTPTSWWLKHPTNPTLNTAVTLRSFVGHSRPARQEVQQPLGRSDAVVITDTRGPESGEIVFRLSADVDRDAVMSLADLGIPLLLAAQPNHHERDRWIVLGDEQIERLIDKSWSTERNGTYSWVEVLRPSGELA